MATGNESDVKAISVPASADLSSYQFYLVKINSSGQLAVCSTRGERAHGVLLDDPNAASTPGLLGYSGMCQVLCGGTFEEGDPITTNSSGTAIKADRCDDVVVGTAVEPGASGARASILIGVAGGATGNPQKIVAEDFEAYDTTDQVAAMQVDGTAASGTAGEVNVLYAKDNRFGYSALGTQTITVPVIVAAGLNIGMDQTDNDGVNLWSNFWPASGLPFMVGNDGAFYFKCTFNLATLAGTDDFHIGFRRAEIPNAAFDDYLDLASLGCEAADGTVDICTILNNGATGVTDTGDTIVAATDTTFVINVSAAGVVTYKHDIAATGTLAAPTTTAAFTFDDGDPVIPFVFMLQANAAQTGVLTINQWEVGYGSL